MVDKSRQVRYTSIVKGKKEANMNTIDPELAVHPLRLELEQEDLDRLNRILFDNSDEDFTDTELAALEDLVYDAVAAKLQTHLGTTALQ